MLYNIGDVLVCKNIVNARCLEMSNPDFDIKCGDQYKITDDVVYTNFVGTIVYEDDWQIAVQVENGKMI